MRSLLLDVSQINQAFIDSKNERAIKRPEKGNPDDTFIEMHVALISAPEIGRSLLGDDEYNNLTEWLEDGEEAILVVGRGKYSFKGSGYVRGGIFDLTSSIYGSGAWQQKMRHPLRNWTFLKFRQIWDLIPPSLSGCNCWFSAPWAPLTRHSLPSIWAINCLNVIWKRLHQPR